MKIVLRVLLILMTLAYPFVVYLGLQMWDSSLFAVMLVILAGLRWFSPQANMGPRGMWVAILLLVASWVWLFDQPGAVKVYPVLVSFSFLFLFSWSLRHPPSIIERLARISEPDLPVQGVAYTRKVTQLWCGFFVINGSISAATGVWGSLALWTLYNGLISYGLMALLFAGEWLVRQRVRRNYA